MRFVCFLGNTNRENRNGGSGFWHSQTGKWYADDNIDCMLMEWHISKKARRSSSRHHMGEPAKQTVEVDMRFKEAPERLI